MGLVKTRRLAAMRKQQRAILLRQGYGGLKAGMKGAKPCDLQAKPWKRACENRPDLFSRTQLHLWTKEAK